MYYLSDFIRELVSRELVSDAEPFCGHSNLFKDKEDHYEVKLMAPGYKRNEIEITINENTLIIGTLESQNGVESFGYSLRLPDGIEEEKITAKLEDGILLVRLPKVDKDQSKKFIAID